MNEGFVENAADAVLRALAAHGVDYFFANPGTDFAPIVEGFARAASSNHAVPQPLVVTHENAAVAMAYGYYLVTGRPQAVMVHVSPGTANTAMAIMDAASDRVPVLLLAGRTPYSEYGAHGARDAYIHWSQEMYDQAGMVREFVKWDYELRRPEQAEDAVARAVQIATSSPPGPIYLQLPREVLATPIPEALAPVNDPGTRRVASAAPYPHPDAMAQLADWIAAAERPLIITAGLGRLAEEMSALGRIAERFALPVVGFQGRFTALPSSHPMHLGYQPEPLLKEADLVIVFDCDVPWIPQKGGPPPGAKVVHIGEDPEARRIPFRSFPADLSITARNLDALVELERVVGLRVTPDNPTIEARRRRLTAESTRLREGFLAQAAAAGHADTIQGAWVGHCLRAAAPDDAIIVNEYSLPREFCPFELPGTWLGNSSCGGLGLGVGTALGAKLAAPDRLVVATVGDGSYMFANPAACHWTAAAHGLPFLTVVLNNSIYGAVRNATLGMYRNGVAARDNGMLLADLGRGSAFEKYAEAHGGVGFRVEDPAKLEETLVEAVAVVTRDRRQVLVNVVMGPPA